MEIESLVEKFIEIYHKNPDKVYFAPGRINLIGEHVDYNGGTVFPCAITLGTYSIVRKREDKIIMMYSMNFSNSGIKSSASKLEFLDFKDEDVWTNYPKGMLKYILKDGYDVPYGMDILFYGNLPNGSGLSSSASIELVNGVMISDLFDLNIDLLKLIKMGKTVENEYIGVNCGIMDQFAIGMGKKDYGILLNCDTLDYNRPF